jgi:hypothetical protein
VTSDIGRNDSDDVNGNTAPREQVPAEYSSNPLSRPGVGNYRGWGGHIINFSKYVPVYISRQRRQNPVSETLCFEK